MSTKLTIPEWVGSALTNGAFLDYADRSLAAYVAVGLEEINLTALGMQLTAALDDLRKAVKRQAAYDETADVMVADGNRDILANAIWHFWNRLQRLSPTHPLMAHVKTLKSEMNAYKGVWEREMTQETSELNGFRGALSTEANQAALAALGLDKAAAALWAANDAVGAAMNARHDEERDRAEERAAGSTPELRKAVGTLLVKAARRVNAVYEIDPDNEKAAKAIGDVATIVEHFRRVAAEAKHHKGGDDPEPGPEPEPTPEPEA